MSSSTSEMGLTAPDDGNPGLNAVTIDCGCLTWTYLDLAKQGVSRGCLIWGSEPMIFMYIACKPALRGANHP